MGSAFRSLLWRNDSFVRLWIAATVSVFGSLVTRLALPFVAILVLDAGPLEVAVLNGLDLGATLLVGLVAGAWVDRLRRRPVLIWADLGRAVVLGSVPVAFVAGALTFWQLLGVALVAAVLTTFFDAADNAYLPTVVERDRLVEANAALAASGSAAEFSAFGIAGVLVQALSAPLAILVDAASFVVSAVLLGSIRRPEPAPPAPSERAPIGREIAAGLRRVARDPVLRAFAGARMAAGVTFGFFGAIYLLFATRELGLGPIAIGLIAGVGGASSFAGAIVAEPAVRRWGFGPVAAGAMAVAALGSSLIPLAPAGAPLVAAAFLVGQQLVGDGALTVYEISETSVRQGLVEDRSLGRVASSFSVAEGLTQLFATVAGGLFAEAAGLRAAAVIAPLGVAVGAAILLVSGTMALRSLPAATVAADERTT